ncbi:hypothetical protein Unana1_06835 [Umbelopsis nana]
MTSRHTNGNHPPPKVPSVFDRLGPDPARPSARRGSGRRNEEQDGNPDRRITVIPPDDPPRSDRPIRRDPRSHTHANEPPPPRTASHRSPLQRPFRSATDIPMDSRSDRRYSKGSENRHPHNDTRISSDRPPAQRERWPANDRRPNDIPPGRPLPPRPNDRNYTRYNRPEPYERPPRIDRPSRRPERSGHIDRPKRRSSPPRDHNSDRRRTSRQSSPVGDKRRQSVDESEHKKDEHVENHRVATPPKELSAEPIDELEQVVEEKDVPAPAPAAALPYLGETFFKDVDQDVPDYEEADDEDDFNVVVDAPPTESTQSAVTSEENKITHENPKAGSPEGDHGKARNKTNAREERERAHSQHRQDKKDPGATRSHHNDTVTASTSSAEDRVPPPPWERHLSKKGKVGEYYYYNPDTDTSTWTFPSSESVVPEGQSVHKSKGSSKQSPSAKAQPDERKRSVEEHSERSTSNRDEPPRSHSDERYSQGRQSGKDRTRDRDNNIPPPAAKRARRESNEAEFRNDHPPHFESRYRQPDVDNRSKTPKPLPSQEDMFRQQEYDRRPGRPVPAPARTPRPAEPIHRRPHSPPPLGRPIDPMTRRPRASSPPPPVDRGMGSSRRWSPPPGPTRGRRLEENGRADDPRRPRDHHHSYPVPPVRHSDRSDRFPGRPTLDNPNRLPVNTDHASQAPASNHVSQDQRRLIRENDTRSVSGRDLVIMNSRVERSSRAHGKEHQQYHPNRR